MIEHKHIMYMGAYSADIWVEKILKGKIKLPPYQRDFVWSWDKPAEDRGMKFLDSLEQALYIPSVTLGDFENETFVIDGQQRLTSLLCLKYNFWPSLLLLDTPADKIPKKENDENDENEEKEEELIKSPFTFQRFQEKYRDLNSSEADTIQYFIDQGEIRKFDGEIALNIQKVVREYNDIFLPYVHIIWKDIKDIKEKIKTQQKFYSQVFNRINTGGLALKPQEIRQALYWVNGGEGFSKRVYDKQFEDTVIINGKPLDFIEFLTIILEKDNNKVLAGYNRSKPESLEKYIDNFISFLTGSSKDKRVLQTWPDTCKQFVTADHYKNFQEEFNKIEYKIFKNQFAADYCVFGLLHWVLQGRKILPDKITAINEQIRKDEENPYEPNHLNKEGVEKYKNTPNSSGRIRTRLKNSIKRWESYTK